MSNNIAPWLQGLDDGWVAPMQPITTTRHISSASHDASYLRGSTSRIPRRSLSGRPSSASASTRRTDSTQKRRPPLGTLNSNDTNTLRRDLGSVRVAGTRSVSEASDGSVLACGTVQKRSKSSSPAKKQATVEWKQRLLKGNVGYGDQTDLFGANGLENIFSRTSNAENQEPSSKSRMRWMPKFDAPMPSSPPPWPSNTALQSNASEKAVSPPGGIEDHEPSYLENSFRSNPFDLQSTGDSEGRRLFSDEDQQEQVSSPRQDGVDTAEGNAQGNRTVSGQTDLEQEDFSPVFISKTKTLTGFDYAALDSHLVKQFNSMKVDLRHPSQEQREPGNVSSDDAAQEAVERSAFTDGPESESLPTVPDISFSENLPTGSPFPNLGKNVEMKRGGYSNYGSFKRRPLSPAPSTAEVSLNASANGLLSPSVSVSQVVSRKPDSQNAPATPEQGSETKSRSSGSPLKLFGAHDTFTSNRLLRRMSQLNPDGTLKLPTLRESSPQPLPAQQNRHVSNASSFGNGELDDYGFNAEITITSASDPSQIDSDQSPRSEVPVPGSKVPLDFHQEESPIPVSTFKMKRKLSKHSTANSRGSTLETQRRVSDERQAPATDSRVYAEGKRPPTSPFKNPTPKRRRTLHASEMQDGIEDMNTHFHSQLQEAVNSRKRRDARSGEIQVAAHPEVLAQRDILRPRNPTPSQRRRQQIEAELRQAAEDFVDQDPEKLEAVMEQIESSMASDEPRTLEQQAQTLASEVAAFTLNVQKPSGEHPGERKRSVTTQDFLDEAMMVMNLIRAKAKPQSLLGSVEESDAEAFGQSTQQQDLDEDQSHLRVSRPPSREGSGWRTRASPQTNARVVSHLRKFQEADERDDTGFIANSIASLQVDDEATNEQVVVVDEHSNIRITGPLPGHEKHEADSATDSHRSNSSATNTQSTDNSTRRTIRTASSRRSDNVGTLAPDAVAHLIGEQVGGMTFDREQQRWVRVHKSPPKQQGSFLELPSNVTSDDDPFREISDLPVDEQKELRRMSSPAKPAEEADVDDKTSVHDRAFEHDDHQASVESRAASNETVMARPVTRDSSSHMQQTHSSSVPSRYTAFASSQQEKVETRATSWSDEEMASLSAIGKARQQLAQQMTNLSPVHEPLAEEAGHASEMMLPSPPNQRISTNIASLQPNSELNAYEEELDAVSGLRDDTALNQADTDIEDIDSPKLRQTPSTRRPFPSSSIYRGAARHMSLRRQTLTNRFTQEAHESSELSLVAPLPGDRMMSLSVSVSRPVAKQQDQRDITDLQTSPRKGATAAASFLWSDLPDFTVHEEDDIPRPSEKVLATRLARHAAGEVGDRYALAVNHLVKILTDVNENEPYWEDLKQLSLRDRSLASLYGLDDFCTRVQEMDVSHNALTQLEGAPFTVRRLDARANLLSGLTCWGHLANLQVLDVSRNRLDSLDGLAGLVHLRELRVDDNEVVSLEGVFQLDGLSKLRARRNRVQDVDFTHARLESLTHLDLTGNPITTVRGLGNLSALTALTLDGCQLATGIHFDRPMPKLESLSLRDCDLNELDISNLPNLRQLNIDDNHLPTITGLGHLTHLDTLSMQRQTLPQGTHITILACTHLEARTLLLSGNDLPHLDLSTTSHLSLRHLELASTGLQSLPPDFGLKMPNLRSLNLNFNALRDVRPLLNIQKLERLSLCGNKIARLRKSVATLGKLQTLRSVDLRETPLTMGLYTSVALSATLSRPTTTTALAKAATTRHVFLEEENDEDVQAALQEAARYAVPPADVSLDRQHQSRIDEDSKLRRRVYELLMANGCRGLRELDGLAFEREAAVARDGVWRRLVELGVVRKSGEGVVEGGG